MLTEHYKAYMRLLDPQNTVWGIPIEFVVWGYTERRKDGGRGHQLTELGRQELAKLRMPVFLRLAELPNGGAILYFTHDYAPIYAKPFNREPRQIVHQIENPKFYCVMHMFKIERTGKNKFRQVYDYERIENVLSHFPCSDISREAFLKRKVVEDYDEDHDKSPVVLPTNDGQMRMFTEES